MYNISKNSKTSLIISNKIPQSIFKELDLEKVLPTKNTEAISKVLAHEQNFQKMTTYVSVDDYRVGAYKHLTIHHHVNDNSSVVTNYTSRDNLPFLGIKNELAYDFAGNDFSKKITYLTPFHWIQAEKKLEMHQFAPLKANDTREILKDDFSEDGLRKLYNNYWFKSGVTFSTKEENDVYTFKKMSKDESLRTIFIKTENTPFGADFKNFYDSSLALERAGLVDEYKKYTYWKSFAYESKGYRIITIEDNQELQKAYLVNSNEGVNLEQINEILSKTNILK